MKEALILQHTVSWEGIRHAVSLQVALLASRHPCHCRQCRCSCTTGGKTSSSALQRLLPPKPSPEKELAEIPLSHSSNLNPGLYLNEHSKETEDSITPVNWRIGFSKLEGECQKIRLHVSTRMFSLCGGSPGVQALWIPRRLFQSSLSTSAIPNTGGLNLGRLS